jgi:hypothetical protein
LKTVGLLAAMLVVASGAGCDTAESRAKAAQVTGDKFMEYIKSGDYERAYHETFTARYRASLEVDSFVKFREGMAKNSGQILGYQMVDYEAKPDLPYVKMVYAVQTQNTETPIYENMKFVLDEDGVWRITETDVQRPGPATIYPPPESRGPRKVVPDKKQ